VDHKEVEDHSHGDIEPAIVRKASINSVIAEQMEKAGISCQPLEIGSHPLEQSPPYSHMFALTSRFTTNKGIIKVRGRNVDFVQILQRN
jgi:hypothetical protein